MRFKTGSNVEVLSKKEVPSGSWCCAKIICGDGHNYTLKYDGFEGAAHKTLVERVPRDAIRPCPPPLEVSKNWVTGDVVEVYDNFSWKVATISKVFGQQCFLVRLVGSYREYRVGKSEIRARQFWQDDKWVLIGKGLSNYENKVDFQKSHIASSHSLKRRSPYFYSQDEAYDGSAEKFRAVEKEGRCLRVIGPNLSTLSDQIDVALPRHRQGGKDIRASLNSRRTCSVGSCSIDSNGSYKSPPPVSASSTEDIDDQFSDAESICRFGYEESNSLLFEKEKLAAEIHRLELHAYRCTIGALHASGPLSWEQEEMVTNLRLSLHISNDEHLMELRNLVSGDSSIHIR